MPNRSIEGKIMRCRHAKRSYRVKAFIKRNGGLLSMAIGWAFLFACMAIDVTAERTDARPAHGGELGLFGCFALFFGVGYMTRGDGDD